MSNGRTAGNAPVRTTLPVSVGSNSPGLSFGNFTIDVRFGFSLPAIFAFLFPKRQPMRRVAGGRDLLTRQQPVPIPPVPAPRPTPAPTPVPFPRGPASNDPVFSIGRQILRRGVAIISAAEILRQVFERGQEVASRERAREIDEIDRQRARRSGADNPLGERTIPDFENAPLGEPLPSAPPRPVSPTLPRPDLVPFPASTPRPATVPAPTPVPASPSIPTPQVPSVSPSPLPSLLPFLNPFVIGLPSGNPINRIATNPAPRTPSLTPGQGGGLGSRVGVIDLPSRQPQPQQAAQRECENVQRRRRKKGKCREGFFIERADRTEFITWRSRECDTVGGRKRNIFTVVK